VCVVMPRIIAMQLQEILFNQGFGTRRVCAGLIQKGLVSIKPLEEPADAAWRVPLDSDLEFEPEGLQFKVSGVPGLPDLVWPYAALHRLQQTRRARVLAQGIALADDLQLAPESASAASAKVSHSRRTSDWALRPRYDRTLNLDR
jgi:hypothetical protein